MENLPLDIKSNILSRLPTESALECKLVCRNWRDFVRHPSFSKMHLNRLKHLSMADKVSAIIKFGYQNLKNQKLKSCFLCFSLCPGDFSLEINDIIGIWVGEGLLDNVDDPDKVENEGRHVVRCLKDACLLETGILLGVKMDHLVKMHDVVRESAIGIVGSNHLMVQADSTLKIGEWVEAERISLMNNTAIQGLYGEPRCSKLSTLFLGDTNISFISEEFFRYMPMLKVLELSRLKLKKLPASLFSIPELQYLDLPEYDEPIGAGSLALLTKLKSLGLSDSCCNWDVDGGPSLEELESLQHLIFLQITIETCHALERLVTSPKLRLCITYLKIKDSTDITFLGFLPSSLVSSLNLANIRRLSSLELKNCGELEELSILMSQNEVPVLKTLENFFLSSMPKLRIVWDVPRKSLCSVNLKRVTISDCPQLEDITWLIHAPNLEILILSKLDGLKEIVSNGSAPKEIFSRLYILTLGSLRNLKRICDNNVKFPLLEKISVWKCPELKKLPFSSSSQNLQMIEGETQWWESLEWEDEATKSHLAPYFRAFLILG